MDPTSGSFIKATKPFCKDADLWGKERDNLGCFFGCFSSNFSRERGEKKTFLLRRCCLFVWKLVFFCDSHFLCLFCLCMTLYGSLPASLNKKGLSAFICLHLHAMFPLGRLATVDSVTKFVALIKNNNFITFGIFFYIYKFSKKLYKIFS